MKKNFVLDTNILLQDPNCFLGFEDNTLIITGTVLQELDKRKTSSGDIGYHTRECIRKLDALRQNGDLLKGVEQENGSVFQVVLDTPVNHMPSGFGLDNSDNRIINTCLNLNQKVETSPVILVTNDINMRVKADICGIQVQEYKNSIVEDSGYTGHIQCEIDPDFIARLYKDKTAEVPEGLPKLYENEFITFKNGSQSALSVYRKGRIELIRRDIVLCSWVRPKNAMQAYAMWALTQPPEELPLVFLIGPAGSAKTFLSTAAGLDATYNLKGGESAYYKMLISRPLADSFDGLGYLPGDLDDKLAHPYQSFSDNLEVLLKQGGKEDQRQIKMQIDDLYASETVSQFSLNFVRGRSLSNAYVICDEAQNATRTQIRDVITRTGEQTKMVIAGDPTQIDVAALDRKNNGLVFAAEAMKGDPLCAIIRFDEGQSVRSPLTKSAISRMKL